VSVQGAKEAAVFRLRRFSERLVGRDRELEALVRTVRVQRLVTCTGEAGVGKSALALTVAERLGAAGTFPGGPWVVTARGIRSVDVLRRAVDSIPAGSLIVLDSLDDALEARHEAVLIWLLRLLQSPKEQQILVTAHRPVGLEGERVMELEPLESSDGRRLLTGRADADVDPEEASALARLLESNPRAIVLAAALLSRVPAAVLRRSLEGALLKGIGHADISPTPLTVMLGIGDDQPSDTRRLLVPLAFAEEEQLADQPSPARLLLQARRLLTQGWYDDALDVACAALDDYQSAGNAAGRATSLLLLAQIAEAQGELARAALVLEEAAATLVSLDDAAGLAIARKRQARIFTLLELPEAAFAALEESRKLQSSEKLDACFAELNEKIDHDDFLGDIERDAPTILLQGLAQVRLRLNLPTK
jgi:tetratricopeptide (TPR) repeat protein